MDKLTELTRQLHNLLRYARVTEVSGFRCRVSTAGLTSGWLNWLTLRAGEDVTWWAPSIGEQVLWLSPGGKPETGIVLPGIYQNAHSAPTTDPARAQTTYRDGAVIRYDTAAHKLYAQIPGDASITTTGDISATVGGALTASVQGNITASSAGGDISVAASAGNIDATAAQAISAQAPSINLTGAVVITGSLTLAGPLATAPGDAGGGVTMQGDVNLTGDLATTGAIVNNGKTIDSTHTHTSAQPGSPTSAPR